MLFQCYKLNLEYLLATIYQQIWLSLTRFLQTIDQTSELSLRGFVGLYFCGSQVCLTFVSFFAFLITLLQQLEYFEEVVYKKMNEKDIPRRDMD